MLTGRIFSSSRYFSSAMLPAMTAVNLTKFMGFALGSAVKFSFIVFLPIHPIPATRSVIVAASRIDFTSLLSDIVCIYKIFELIHLHFHLRFHHCTPQAPFVLCIP